MVTDRTIEEENGETREAEQVELERLRVQMEESRRAVDPSVSHYVQSTLEFGVAQTRFEYRGFAQRNWRTVQKLGKRLVRMFVVLVIVLIGLGLLSYSTTLEIQHSRRDRISNSCKRGNNFVAKLKEDIAKQPGVERAKSEEALPETIALVQTLVPIGDCTKAVEEAGL